MLPNSACMKLMTSSSVCRLGSGCHVHKIKTNILCIYVFQKTLCPRNFMNSPRSILYISSYILHYISSYLLCKRSLASSWLIFFFKFLYNVVFGTLDFLTGAVWNFWLQLVGFFDWGWLDFLTLLTTAWDSHFRGQTSLVTSYNMHGRYQYCYSLIP